MKKMQPPAKSSGFSHAGVHYPVDKDGFVTIPDNALIDAQGFGFTVSEDLGSDLVADVESKKEPVILPPGFEQEAAKKPEPVAKTEVEPVKGAEETVVGPAADAVDAEKAPEDKKPELAPKAGKK